MKKLKMSKLGVFPPAIDPLTDKNKPLSKAIIHKVMREFGVDMRRPIISQVSRFDYWKDPLGVIKAYKIVKKEIPSVQLVLMGNIPEDDPEGWKFLDKIKGAANNDPDIYILHMSNDDSKLALKANILQSASQVVIQKSIKEGFGLTVSEALWAGKPVVGGNTGGITLQIQDGKNGFLVDSVEEAAGKIIWLLENPKRAKRMGERGREIVREHFLSLRYLRDYLKFLNKF